MAAKKKKKSLAAEPTTKLEPTRINGWNAAHREMLAHMATADLAKILAAGAPVVHLNFAAVNIASTDLEAALRIYDALLTASLDDVGPVAPVDGTYWLLTAHEKKDPAFTTERAKKYLARWKPFGKTNTLVYYNLAMLHLALGQKAQAVATLREAIEEGDPHVAEQIADKNDPDIRALLKERGFKDLAKVEPAIPVGLRGLELAIASELDEQVARAAMACDLEWVNAHPDDNPADMYELGAKGRAKFQGFGTLPDGGELAFWKRKAGAPLAECPVVIFGSDGQLSVYARDFDGFLTLLAHGAKLHDVESEGFHFEAATWKPPSPRELAKKMKPVKALLAQAVTWSPAVKKRKPEQERARAMALVPELMKEIASLRGAPRKAAAKKR